MSKIAIEYKEIYDFENLYAAYIHARKNKRYREEVLNFTARLDEELISLQNDLIWKSYKVGKYRLFWVYDPKKRLVMALRFRDRVMQWAVYQKLNPLFDKQFIEDSFGCRVGKGTHAALDRLQYWMRQVDRKEKRYFYLKLDISKYFYRVDHKVLLGILRRKIEDEEVVHLLEGIIESEDTKFGLPRGIGPSELPTTEWLNDVGMPIGNLTSQMFANIYLNELDQFAKHELHVHYWIRYMDDIIVLGDSKEWLWQIKEAVEEYLNQNLHLDLNNKTTVRPISTGIEFVGYRIWSTHRKIKKQTLKKMKARLKYIQGLYNAGIIDLDTVKLTVSSYRGITMHFNSYGLRRSFSRRYRYKRNIPKDGDSHCCETSC